MIPIRPTLLTTTPFFRMYATIFDEYGCYGHVVCEYEHWYGAMMYALLVETYDLRR